MSKKEKIFFMIAGVAVYKSWKWLGPVLGPVADRIVKEFKDA